MITIHVHARLHFTLDVRAVPRVGEVIHYNRTKFYVKEVHHYYDFNPHKIVIIAGRTKMKPHGRQSNKDRLGST